MGTEKSKYHIKYLGIGGDDEQQPFVGDHHHLAETITMIENSGGQQLTVSRQPANQLVYEAGGFLISR